MEKKYFAMTVNERLVVSGLMNDFERAVEDKAVSRVISILKQVELTDGSIDPILENHGLKREDDLSK
jgi:hypothetical protein